MRHTPTQAVLPPSILSKNFLHSISPSQSASPSVAHYSAGLAHDARNMLAAMDIYCELLASPGVLKPDDKHLLDELRLLRDSSGKLLDRLLIEALKCLAATDPGQGQTPRDASGMGQGAGQSMVQARAKNYVAIGLGPAATGVSPRSRVGIPAALMYDPADAYLPDVSDAPGPEASLARAAAARGAGYAEAGNAESSSADTLIPDTRSSDSGNTDIGSADSGSADSGSAYSGGAYSGNAALLRTSAVATILPTRAGKRVTDLAGQLQAMLPMLSALAGPRVHISASLEACPTGELFMPSVDLTRVLINLVRNAAEAMSIGGRIVIAATATSKTLATSAENSIDSAPSILLSIEDNGPGIPLTLLDRIFDLQVSSATQEESSRPRMQFRPRGLGLRIVREFVEASGGSVRALRLPDRGSRFEIVLPLVTVKVTQFGGAR